MKAKNTSKDTASDPDSCINQSLRRWKCRCSECTMKKTKKMLSETARRARGRRLVTEIRRSFGRFGILITEADIAALIRQELGQEEMSKEQIQKLVSDLGYRANIPNSKKDELAMLLASDDQLAKMVKAKKWDNATDYVSKKIGQKGSEALGTNKQVFDDVENAFEKITAGMIKKYADVIDADDITAAMNDALAAFAGR